MAVPIVHAIATAINGGGTTLTVAVPTGTVSGDLLVACIYSNNTPGTPAGWTLVASRDSGHTGWMYCYRRLAGSSEPASYDWTAGAGNSTGGIARISGADPTSPVDVFATTFGGTANPIPSPSVTTAGPDRLILRSIGGPRQGSLAFSAPAGHAQQWNIAGSINFQATEQALFTADQVTAGATGTANVGTASHNWAAITVAIAPPAGGSIVPIVMHLNRMRRG